MAALRLVRIYANAFIGLAGIVSGLWLLPINPVLGVALIFIGLDGLQDSVSLYYGRTVPRSLAPLDVLMETLSAALSVYTAVVALKLVAIYNIYAYLPLMVLGAMGFASSLADVVDSLSKRGPQPTMLSSLLLEE
ncbi:MAG: hypothetical protein DRJ67_03720 [Thermoprotei archaeon]|nr:MAG: hypothetical protein DRJ67_03720 [Thermoprotei archaeon]